MLCKRSKFFQWYWMQKLQPTHSLWFHTNWTHLVWPLHNIHTFFSHMLTYHIHLSSLLCLFLFCFFQRIYVFGLYFYFLFLSVLNDYAPFTFSLPKVLFLHLFLNQFILLALFWNLLILACWNFICHSYSYNFEM